MSIFEIRPNPRAGCANEQPYDLVRQYSRTALQSFAWGMEEQDLVALWEALNAHMAARLRSEHYAPEEDEYRNPEDEGRFARQ